MSTNDALQRAAMGLLDAQFEAFLKRVETVNINPEMRAAFFSGVSAGMDLCNTISGPDPDNLMLLKRQAE